MTSAETVEIDQASGQKWQFQKFRVLNSSVATKNLINRPTAHSSILLEQRVLVRACASTETHFQIKKKWQMSECVYKYQQICLILYTEVQKKNSRRCTHITSGGCTLAACFHSKSCDCCECALKWTISMLHRNSLYHGEVLNESDFFSIVLWKYTHTRLFKMGVLCFVNEVLKLMTQNGNSHIICVRRLLLSWLPLSCPEKSWVG